MGQKKYLTNSLESKLPKTIKLVYSDMFCLMFRFMILLLKDENLNLGIALQM